MKADLYYNFLLKKVFSCRGLFRSVVNHLLYSFLTIIGANRLRGEMTYGGETTRGVRPGGKRLGAKRLGEEMVWGRNDPDSYILIKHDPSHMTWRKKMSAPCNRQRVEKAAIYLSPLTCIVFY